MLKIPFFLNRLYAKALFAGFRRSRVNQYEDQARLKIEGVNDRADVAFYLGKRVVYVQKTAKGYTVSLLYLFLKFNLNQKQIMKL